MTLDPTAFLWRVVLVAAAFVWLGWQGAVVAAVSAIEINGPKMRFRP